jgi:hypothetical protein
MLQNVNSTAAHLICGFDSLLHQPQVVCQLFLQFVAASLSLVGWQQGLQQRQIVPASVLLFAFLILHLQLA